MKHVPENKRIKMANFAEFFKEEPENLNRPKQMELKLKGGSEPRTDSNYQYLPKDILSKFSDWLGRSLEAYESKPVKDIFKEIDTEFMDFKEKGEEERQKKIRELRGSKEIYHIKD